MFDFDVVTGPTHGKPQPAAEVTTPVPAPRASTRAEPPRPDKEADRERRAA